MDQHKQDADNSSESVNESDDSETDENESDDSNESILSKQESDHLKDESSCSKQESDHLKEESNCSKQESDHLKDESSCSKQESDDFKQSSQVKARANDVKAEMGEGGVRHELHPVEADKGMDSMFASVWVKVEMTDNEDNEPEPEDATDLNYEPRPSTRKKSKQKKQEDATEGEKKPRKVPTNVLKCPLCEYTTVYKTALIMHKIGHSSEKKYTCSECNYRSKYQNALTRHIKILHQKDDPPLSESDKVFDCDQCDYKTNFKWNLKAHKRKHNKEKQYKCSHCSFETAYRHNFLKHSRTHQPKDKPVSFYKCDKCTFVTKFEGHITRHLAKIHNEVTDTAYKCDMCDFSTRVRWRLNIHKTKSKQNNLLACRFCNFQTYFMCESKKHKVVHYDVMYGYKNVHKENYTVSHNSEIDATTGLSTGYSNAYENVQKENYSESNPQCDTAAGIADYNLKNETAVFNAPESHNSTIEPTTGMHIPTTSSKQEYMHNSTDDYNDMDNYYVQDTVTSLNKYQKDYTVDPETVEWKNIKVLESKDKERPFQCLCCDYTSRFKAAVKRHYQRHHTGSNNRPYECKNCDFSTKTKDKIALHNRRSKCDIPLFCNICQFSTIYKCQYAMHQKGHYDNKCSECDYSSKRKYELQKHYMVAHLGNGLKCQYCDYVAARKESILSHETIHTGIKPFKCEHCDYMGVKSSLLNKHMRRHHSNLMSGIVVVSESKIDSLKQQCITTTAQIKELTVAQSTDYS